MTFLTDNLSIVDVLKWRSIHQSDRLAICYLADGEKETERLTYQTLDNAARKIASKLQSLDLEGKYALMLYNSGAEFVKAFFGCLYAGVIAVPTYIPKSKQLLQKIEKIAQDCNAHIVLTTQELLDEMSSTYLWGSDLSNILTLVTDNIFDNIDSNYQPIEILLENIAFIQYTSGSTSQPKGVIVSHKNIVVNELMIQRAYALSENSVGVTWLPLFHDMGLIASLLNAIFIGYPFYMMPPSAFIRRPIRWLQCIGKYKGTYTCAPNFAYDLCVEKIPVEMCGQLDLSSLKTAVVSAEPVQYISMEKFIHAFSNYGLQKNVLAPSYGLAEATVFVTGKTGSQLDYAYLDNRQLQKNKVVYLNCSQTGQILLSCGHTTYLGQQIKIVNPETQIECAKDEIGEIWISGEHVAKGYLNKLELNETIFAARLNGFQESTFLRTGDLGFINQSGELFVTGRLKDLIIINGCNYYPHDIELTVENAHEAIRKNYTAAFSVDIDFKEELIVVAEVPRSLMRIFEVENAGFQINAALMTLNQLVAYEIVFIESGTLPKTTSGKRQRQACKIQYLNNELTIIGKWKSYNHTENNDITYLSTLSLPEELVLKTELINCMVAWIANAKKISIENVALTAKFSDFSLDSIQLVELSNELEKIIKMPIHEKILYEHPGIQETANFLIKLSTTQLNTELASIRANITNSFSEPEKKKKIAIPKFVARQTDRSSEELLEG